MRRREFITLVGGAAATWPLAARAQQAAMPVIGYLGSETPEKFGIRVTAFQQGLSAMGFDDGRNVKIEYRWANGQNDRLPALAADLVRRQVAVIATPGGSASAIAAKAATNTIPIVFETGVDPVAAGLVKSLSRPEGNVTGITSLNVYVAPKRVELMHELLPKAKGFAVLVNPANPTTLEMGVKGSEGPARALALQLHFLNATTEREIESAFEKLSQLEVGGLIVAADIFFNSRTQQFAALTLKHGVPASPFGARVRRGRRLGELRWQYQGLAQASRCLHWPHPQGREARQLAGPAGNQDRADHQSQDRQGTGHQHPKHTHRTCRRGHRIAEPMSAIGT